MFKIARASCAASRPAIARRIAQPTHHLYSTAAPSDATPATAPAPSSTTGTPNNSKPVNGGTSHSASSSKAPARPPIQPKSKPAPAPAKAAFSSSSSSSSSTPTTISAAARPVPSTKPGPGGLPFYQPKTIGFSDPVPASSKSGNGNGNGNGIGSSSSSSNSTDLDIDWENSYHGISARPVTSAQFKVLMEPISEQDIEVKPDGVIYLPEIKYRRRLNEAFGPMGWGLIPRSEPTLANGVATREYALVIGGRFVAQAQGENTYFNPEGMPSAVEGCKSNALMRCCKDLGIASELWDPVFIRMYKAKFMQEVWVEHATTKKKRQLWFKTGQVNVAYPWKKV